MASERVDTGVECRESSQDSGEAAIMTKCRQDFRLDCKDSDIRFGNRPARDSREQNLIMNGEYASLILARLKGMTTNRVSHD